MVSKSFVHGSPYLKFRQTTEHYFKMKTISNKLFRLYKYLSDLNYIYLWHNTLSSLFYELHITHIEHDKNGRMDGVKVSLK